MLDTASSLLQKVRTVSSTFFYHFGIHCATHQIRLILISSVVITSLFYPALSLYSSSSPHASLSLSDSTSRILDSFLAASAVSGFYAQHDLRNVWEGHQALRVVEDTISRAKCGKQRTLRVERILIQSPWIDDEDSGALNHHILQSTLDIERSISDSAVAREGRACLKKSDGECFVLSPLAFWQYSTSEVASDANILDTLSPSEANNVSISGIPVTPQMVLAGRGSYDYEHDRDKFDYAKFLALTYFFPDSDCLGTGEHMAWLEVVKEAVGKLAVPVVPTQEPTLIALEYDTLHSRASRFSAISLFVYLAYVAFFIYVARAMRQMVAVHSRIGLTFTALVEIAVSTVTSLSVCALVGFKVTMVPWELLPIVIVFVGAENMFSLVDAVTRTSITIPVKQRIAVGLSHAGTSNTLKVVSYNAILGVLAVLAGTGAIRQFCVFAIVVLVAHWFLAHTFFLAVLSIDIQRLELDELLRQNASLVPNGANGNAGDGNGVGLEVKDNTPWGRFLATKRGYFRRRITKDISLFLLLAITATLYYTTYAASTGSENGMNSTTPPRGGALSRAKPHPHLAGEDNHTPAWHIWNTLNPDDDALLHLRIETPTILTLRSVSDLRSAEQDQNRPKVHRSRFPMRTLRLMVWFFEIVVLPITATTGCLYLLCLYLLKDAELLEAQRNRAEPDSADIGEETPLDDHVSFATFPRILPTDVELIAASKDGTVVASIGVQNEFVIMWRKEGGKQSHIRIDTVDILLRAASTSSATPSITSLCIDERGTLCAVGTGAGAIAVWAAEEGRVKALPHLTLDRSVSAVTDLQFLRNGSLLATYADGSAVKWTIGNVPSPSYITPCQAGYALKSLAVPVNSGDQLMVAVSMQDGTIHLVNVDGLDPILIPDCVLRAGNPSDVVAKVSACYAEINGGKQLIIGAATEAGIISLWDGQTGENIHIIDDTFGEITNLQLSPVPRDTCRHCGELPLEAFTISFSVGSIVLFYRAHMPSQARSCSCARNIPRPIPIRDTTFGKRSRSNSISSSVNSISPSNLRSRLSSTALSANNQSALDTSSFPVSGHGVHSRRASEKDSLRRLDNLPLPLVTDEGYLGHPVGPLDGSPPSPGPRSPFSSSWHNLQVIRLAETPCERGSWDVSGAKIIGVRRKTRSHGKTKGGSANKPLNASSQGLTPASLERWELWSFDPSKARFQSSPLLSLIADNSGSRSRPPTPERKDLYPRLPFTRVSPLLIGNTHSMAGFGNTVGVFNFCAG